MFVEEFLSRFHCCCAEEGIRFDEKGWYPRFTNEGKSNGSRRLVGTPEAFAAYCRVSAKATLQYALYFAKPFAGERELFDDWVKRRFLFGLDYGPLLAKEIPYSLLHLRKCGEITEILKERWGVYRCENWQVPIKRLTTKPMSEWLQYAMMIFCSAPPKDLFMGILDLEERGVFDSQLARKIEAVLIDCLELRRRRGNICGVFALSTKEINLLIETNRLIQAIADLVNKRAVQR